MNEANLGLLLQDIASREDASQVLTLPSLVDPNFHKQTAFVLSPAKRKAGFTTRRAGKSSGCAIILIQNALERPNSECLYVALTRDSAKAIMLPILRDFNTRFNIGMEIPDNGTLVTFPNGSRIVLFGADAHLKLHDRLLGRKLKVAVIDEGASWRSDVRRLVYETIEPALTDLDGALVMIGTPGDVAYGLFYDITIGKEKGWELHEWDTYDNPYMREQHDRKIKRLLEIDPSIVSTPAFRRNYKKEWIVDDEALVYRFKPVCGFYTGELPQSCRYLLGVDLGYFPDPSAFVVLAYSEHSPHLYLVECFKKEKLVFSAVAAIIKELQTRYEFDAMVVDNANKQGVEEMRQVHGLDLKPADKADKRTFQELLNSDLSNGLVKIPEVGAEALIKEWANLLKKWNQLHTKWEEDPQLPNHLADAFLYAWRRAKHWTFLPQAKPILPGTPEWLSLQEERIEEEAERAERIARGLEEPSDDPLERPDWD